MTEGLRPGGIAHPHRVRDVPRAVPLHEEVDQEVVRCGRVVLDRHPEQRVHDAATTHVDVLDGGDEQLDRLVEPPGSTQGRSSRDRERVREGRNRQLVDELGRPVEAGPSTLVGRVPALEQSPGQRDLPPALLQSVDGLGQQVVGARVALCRCDLGQQEVGTCEELLVADLVEGPDAGLGLAQGLGRASGPEVHRCQDQPAERRVVGHRGLVRQPDRLPRGLGRLGEQPGLELYAAELEVDPGLLRGGTKGDQLAAGRFQGAQRDDGVAELLMGLGQVGRALGRPQRVSSCSELMLRRAHRDEGLAGPAEGEQLDGSVGLLLGHLDGHLEPGVEVLGLLVAGQRGVVLTEEAEGDPDVPERRRAHRRQQGGVGLGLRQGVEPVQHRVTDPERLDVPAEVVEDLHPAEVGACDSQGEVGLEPEIAGAVDEGESVVELAALRAYPGKRVGDACLDVEVPLPDRRRGDRCHQLLGANRVGVDELLDLRGTIRQRLVDGAGAVV